MVRWVAWENANLKKKFLLVSLLGMEIFLSSCSVRVLGNGSSEESSSATYTAAPAQNFINSTNKTTFALSGTCPASSASVQITAGVITTTATCTGGAWHADIDLSSLSDGQVSFTTSAQDSAGVVTVLASFSISKDTTPPSAPGVASAVASSVSMTPTWNLTASGEGSGRFRYKIDSDDFTSTYQETSSLSFQALDLLTPGLHTLYAQERDEAGNWSASASAQFTVLTTTVEPVYPVNGLKWLDHIGNNGTDPFTATDAPCVDEYTYKGCLHSGMLRKATLTGITSCDGLQLSDQLGAFVWTCKLVSGTATAYILGLKEGQGLGNLLEPTSFKQNRLIASGAFRMETSLGTWWTNPVVPLPDNSGGAASYIKLDSVDDDGAGPDQAYSPSTLFTLASSRETQGYILNESKLGLVVLPGAVLSYGGSATPNCSTGFAGQGFPNGGGSDSTCVVSLNEWLAFFWIEGHLNGKPTSGTQAQVGLNFFAPATSYVRNLTVHDNLSHGLWMEFGYSNYLVGIHAYSNGGNGLYEHYSDENYTAHALLVNNGDNGYENYDPDNNIHLYDIRAIGNANAGIATGSSAWGTFVNLHASHNGGKGLHFADIWASPFTLFSATATNNAGDGAWLHGPDYSAIARLTSLNNGGAGIRQDGSMDYTILSQLVSAHNASYGISLYSAVNSSFSGNLLLGSNVDVDCAVTASTNPGLDGLCNSAAHLVLGTNTSDSFRGAVTSDDSVNTSDSNGTASYSSALDWLGFANPFRFYGPSAAGPMKSAARGRCTSGVCQIWDWTLNAFDTILRNQTFGGDVENAPFIPGQPCPPALSGNQAIHNTSWAGNPTFLTNAMEIVDDYVGNEDGLCESNEACIYLPNFGPYAGEGELSTESCIFQDGLVSGVKVYAYPTNGR